MSSLIPKKFILSAMAWALFLGCLLGSSRLYNSIAFAVAAVLISLLTFVNRNNKRIIILPILMLVLLWGSFEYGYAATGGSVLEKYEGQIVKLEGIVADEPVETEYGQKFTLKSVYYVNNGKLYKSGERLLIYGKKDAKVAFGDRVEMTAELGKAAKSRNFGDFSFEKYYQSKNIYIKAYPQQISKLASDSAGPVNQLLYYGRQKVKLSIYSAMPKREAAILYGILTGSKSEIDEDVMQVFSLTGLAHILSVSGLHIGFLVLIIGYVLKPFKLKDNINHIATFVAVLLYIMLIGAPVPALRALVMFAVMLGGKIWGRKYDLNASVSVAAILLLLYNPLLIHDPSFIISFACIYAIIFLHQPVSSRLGFLPSWLRNSLALSAAVWIGITPVLIYYFNYVSIINILLNVAAVPIAFLITLAGFAGVIVGIVISTPSIFIFSAAYYLIKLLYLMSEKALLIPGAGFVIPALSGYIYVLYYGAALLLIDGFWNNRSLAFKRGYSAVLAAAIGVCILLNILPGRSLQINYVDVGQGDCSVLRTPYHRTIVIDGGGSSPWQDGSYDIGQKITVPALLHMGIWRIDTIIVSHIHDDHLGGVLSILDKFKVNRVILPESDRYGTGEYASENYNELIAKCSAKNIPISYLKKGDRIVVDKELTLNVLGPEKPFIINTDSDVNNNSLVIKLKYKGFDALFTGDIQQEGEQRVKESYMDIDVLKVAHHGSPYSTTKDFIDMIKPEYSIISVGKNNYGHPSEDVIERLNQAGSTIFRTDENGGIRLTTDGLRLRIKTVR